MVTKLPKTDVVTVGVGWTGGIIAAEAAKAGLKVVGLERGGNRGTENFSMKHDELRYAIRGELMQDLSRETLTFRNNSGQRALPMRQYGSFMLGNGVGGAGTHWNGMTDRYNHMTLKLDQKRLKDMARRKLQMDYSSRTGELLTMKWSHIIRSLIKWLVFLLTRRLFVENVQNPSQIRH